jgi:uncharacterized repeat protein (TIGR01451 family)
MRVMNASASGMQTGARLGIAGLLVALATVSVAGLGALGASPASANPNTLYAAASVQGTGDCADLADACTLATALSDVSPGGTIELVTPGTTALYSGNFTVATPGTSAGSPVTIEPYAGVNDPVLDGAASGTVLTVNSGVYLDISALTIQNGECNCAFGGGAGINNSGTLTVSDSIVTNNSAAGNNAGGGGIDNSGTLTVSDSTVSDNSVSGPGVAGAGIYSQPGGALIVSNSVISQNTSATDAGGIFNDDSTLSVTDSTVSDNTATFGGAGIWTQFGTSVITNSTVASNNVGGGFGGGIYNQAPLTLTDDTITNNTAASGGGIDTEGALTIGATILAENVGSDCDNGFGPSITDGGYNIADDASCSFSATGSTNSSATLDASLGSLQNNGGPTDTILPTSTSPAADVIPNPTTVNGMSVCPRTDQTGTSGPVSPQADCTIGAVEARTIFYASAPSALGLGNCLTPTNACTLTTALSDVGPGGTIELVTSGTEGTSSTYYSGNFTVDTPGTSAGAPVTIEPYETATPILDGAASGTVLTVDSGVYLDISGVTIQNGSGSDEGGYDDGGGIYAFDGNVTITDSTVSDSSVNGEGGGIYDYGGMVTVTDSTVSDNSAGGNGGGILAEGTMTLTDSTVSGNSARSGAGGGILNAGTLTLTDSTLSGNSAGANGGGINSTKGLTYLGATIVANSDTSGGDCLGDIIDEGYNIDSDGTCGLSATSHSISDSTTLDASLGSLQNNGGSTDTIRPTSTSPAADVIPDPTTVNGVSVCPRTDQTGASGPPSGQTNCTIGAVEALTAPNPSLTVKKSSSTTSYSASGQPITYDYLVTNTGNVTVSNVTVNDTETAPATQGNLSPITCPESTLAPGASETCTASYTTTQADVDHGSLNDTATATGTAESGSGITVQVSPNPVVETGQSEVHAVVQVEASPSFANDSVDISSTQLQEACTSLTFEHLQGGGTTESPQVTSDGIDAVLDDNGNATVVVDGTGCVPGTSLIEAALTVAPYDMAIATLSVDPSAPSAPGVSGYPTLIGGQAGEVETGDNNASGDSDVYAVFDVEAGASYAGQSVQISASQLEARCLSGWRWEPGNVTAPGTFGPISSPPLPSGSNTTGQYATAILDASGNAVFVFEGASCAPGVSVVIADVSSGTSPTYTTTFTLNPPQVTFTPTTVSATSSLTIPAAQSPSLTVTKSSSTTSYSAPGQPVAYNFLVTNTGNVTLSGISVNDTQSAPATQANLSAISCPKSTLAPGASETCTATYTVTQADVNNGSVNDTATASGTAPGATSPTTSASSSATVPAVRTPKITIVKSASITSFDAAGTPVTYSYKVTNTGNVTLNPVTVTDPMVGLSAITCPGTSLAPGAAETCTATYTTTKANVSAGAITNTATATGTAPSGTKVTATSSVTVPVIYPTTTVLSLSKTSVSYGTETPETFTVTVSSSGGTPTGTVTIGSSAGALCTVTLSSGTGHCSLTATQLPVGAYTNVVATYAVKGAFAGSSSTPAKSFSVTKDSTVTTVSESPSTVPYGDEEAAVFTVTVKTHEGEAVPNGEKVTVDVGSVTCTVTLTNGTGTCTIAKTALGAGSYSVTASYGGDANLSSSSATCGSRLTVTKDSTVTTVSESHSTVTYGDEEAAVFTVTVKTHDGEAVPNGETVTVHVGSVTCTVTLTNGTGTCTIAKTALGDGSYSVSATYSGDANLSGSSATCGSKLTVTKD